MARAQIRRMPGIKTTIRMSAASFTLSSTNGPETHTLDLRKADNRDLRTLARITSQLHGIRA